MGRISVPAKLRKDLCIPIERDMEIFIYEDEDKNKYICYLIPDDEIEKKKKLARELRPFPAPQVCALTCLLLKDGFLLS